MAKELKTDPERDPQIAGTGAQAGDEHTDAASGSSSDSSSGGQVSEVASMDPDTRDTPISDDQSIAGDPTDESGQTQQPTEAGPNAKPGGNVESNRTA